jgi:hypothetical protein
MGFTGLRHGVGCKKCGPKTRIAADRKIWEQIWEQNAVETPSNQCDAVESAKHPTIVDLRF